MEQIERLEDIESRALLVVDSVGMLMKLLGCELKEEQTREEIVVTLKLTVDEIQNIGKDLHEIIDELD
jgi:hypothetical protein